MALTSDQLEEIREAFKLFDTDDSGTIDSDGEQAYCSAAITTPPLNAYPSASMGSRALCSSQN